MTDCYIGEIRILPYTYAPFGWAYCNGQLIPISQNQVLYAVIGSTFGGNWRTTMGVPRLMGRTAMGTGNAPGLTLEPWAKWGGSEGIIATHQYLPSHDHTAKAALKRGTTHEPSADAYLGVTFRPGEGAIQSYTPDAENTPMAYEALAEAGQSYPHENRQPVLGTAFCLALEGVFPSRN